jgi:hypothetical protein
MAGKKPYWQSAVMMACVPKGLRLPGIIELRCIDQI